LVTTATFGHDSYELAKDKPIAAGRRRTTSHAAEAWRACSHRSATGQRM
jgi:hypothetical protein